MESNWIKVSEQMPENIGWYLVFCNDGEQRIAKVAVNGWWTELHGHYYGDMSVGSSKPIREVTHWQPLPQPPKR